MGRVGGLVVVALVAAACGQENRITEASSSPTTEAPATPTTPPAESERQAVIDAYLAAGQAMDEASMIPDPDHPDLAATHSGGMLDVRQETVRELAEDGLVIRFPEDSPRRSVVTSVRFDDLDDVLDPVPEGKELAVVEACAVDHGEAVHLETGEPLPPREPTTVWWTALMLKEEGAWKLRERREDHRVDGVGECPGDVS